MLFNANFVVLAALLAAGVHAQTPTTTDSAAIPTSTSQIPTCVLDCAESALNSSCTSITDPCICTDVQFQNSAEACLKSKCSAADQQAGIALQNALCAGVSSSGSGSATSGSASSTGSAASSTGSASAGAAPSGSSVKSGSSSGTASSTSATTSSSRSAGDKISFGQTGFFALGISVVGAVVGGLMV